MLKKSRCLWQHLVLTAVCAAVLVSGALAATAPPGPPGDLLAISGLLKNPYGSPVRNAEVEFLVNGRRVKPLGVNKTVITGKFGAFVAELQLPAGTLPAARVEVTVHKPGWRELPATPVKAVAAGTNAAGHRVFQANQLFTLRRQITPAFWIATAVLLVVYLLIAFDWMHRTLAALLGAALLLFISYTVGTFDKLYFILSFEDAMRSIDLNVIFLLMGMMIIVGVTKKTGMFQWLAYKAYALARGNVFLLAIILMIITAVVSAFLDNVTTMLLMIPVTIEIAVTLKINPIVLLVSETFASNVGGTATLIGDPPNILIGSYANLSFGAFVLNLALICIIALLVTAVYFVFWHKKDYLKAEVKDVAKTVEYLREEYRITDRKLLIMCLALLAFTVFLFVIHGELHMEPSIAALTGAMLLLAISRVDIVEMLEHEVEWPTLVFFMALFIVVSGAEETGLIQVIAEWVRHVSGGNLTMAVIMVLWVSAIASAFIDNIPFTATMLPIVYFLNHTIPGAQSGVLWWALALGACLGGNGTMIGASANVVTVGMAEKAGYEISFMEYMKACFVPMLLSVALAMGYLLIAYRYP
jgi:Na+/H+ antiporter NhaD/arsenite permease-like protein